MPNQQLSLFPPEKPSPLVRNLIVELNAEKELVDKAVELAASFLFIDLEFGSIAPSIEQLIKFLVETFGYGIRLHLFEIIEILCDKDDIVGNYVRNYFTAEVLQESLSGEAEKQRVNDESTLDELFARTLKLRSTDKFKEVIEFVAKLREYSPFNNMLVKLQRPNAKYYATAKHWKKKFKRDVKPEALPIVILRPMGPVMLVYEVDDTLGGPLPSQIENPFAVSGDFETDLYYQTCLSCKKIGIEVKEANLAKTHAGTAIRESQETDIKLIVQLNQNHDVKVQYATLCHELAHLFLGHLGGDPFGNEWNSRIGLTLTQRELEAESVSYILCVRAGLQSNSAEYLSGYLNDPEDLKKISVETIIKTVTYIEQMQTKSFRPRKKKKEK